MHSYKSKFTNAKDLTLNKSFLLMLLDFVLAEDDTDNGGDDDDDSMIGGDNSDTSGADISLVISLLIISAKT